MNPNLPYRSSLRILALDTATVTGWAYSGAKGTRSGVWDCSIRTKATKSLPADHPGRRFQIFTYHLNELLRSCAVDLIVYEKIVGGRHAGGNVSLIQKGLEAVVLTQAYARGIPCWDIAAGSLKKWATGSGLLTNESKDLVARNAHQCFPDQDWVLSKGRPDDNQADALWLLDLTRQLVRIVPVERLIECHPKDLINYVQQITKIKWAGRA